MAPSWSKVHAGAMHPRPRGAGTRSHPSAFWGSVSSGEGKIATPESQGWPRQAKKNHPNPSKYPKMGENPPPENGDKNFPKPIKQGKNLPQTP